MNNKFFLLFIALYCSMITSAVQTSGTCGGYLTWSYNASNKTLAIMGTGQMSDYSYSNKAPWEGLDIRALVISSGVTSIGESAFSHCNMKVINIPNSVTNIGFGAFANCDSLKVAKIGSGKLANAVFGYCKALQNVTLGKGVTSIGDNVFNTCISLISINVEEQNEYYCSENGILFDKNKERLIRYPSKKTDSSYVIPESVSVIEKYAFASCKLLETITIPNQVTSIEDNAFSSCYSLKSIKIPDNLMTISYGTFSGCKSLTTITIPDNVTEIGKCAFEYCESLQNISIANSVMVIGEYAFASCNSLKTIVIPNSVVLINKGAFSSCKSLQKLYYPKDLSISNVGANASICVAYEGEFPQLASSQTIVSTSPLLTLEQSSLSFIDISHNNRIDADERCSIKFRIKNCGKGVAQNCEARIKMTGAINGISVNEVKLPTIIAGQTYEVTIPVVSNIHTSNGTIKFSIEVHEPNGFGVAPFDLTVATKAYEPPYLQVVDYNIASNSGKIKKMEPFTLTFNLQNTKYGTADDIIVKLNLPTGIFVMDDNTERRFTQIKSGEVKQVSYTLIANNNYATSTIPITIDVKEKHGKFAENRKLDIALNQTTSSTIQIAAKEEPQQERKEIQLAMMKSEVDRNIPVSNTKNPNTFVLIIANEHYSQVASVPFALNDGNIFREYCIKTLGIGEKHIKYLSDATGNQIKSGVNWLANLTEAFDEPQIIVYYAGHGIPDEANKSAYLLPVDGSGTDVTTGYKLDNLYTTLGKMPASQITVFMDACFSGSKRENGMIASARGVALRVKSGVPQGNMVVFSAAQGDETAYPNREQQHGLFTYYLLKKLQETQGDIALKDLGDYITKQVSQQSLLLNSKKQTPCVTPSVTLGDQWQNWKLK